MTRRTTIPTAPNSTSLEPDADTIRTSSLRDYPYPSVRLAHNRTIGYAFVSRAGTKKPGGMMEVSVVEGSNSFVVENSGSRRSSAERREEILVVALSVLAERGYR